MHMNSSRQYLVKFTLYLWWVFHDGETDLTYIPRSSVGEEMLKEKL